MIRHHDVGRAWGRLVAAAVSLAVLFAASSRPALAQPNVSLGIGLSLEMFQGGTSSILISATNNGTTFDLADLVLGLQLRPKGSVAGNLTITGIRSGTNTVWTNPSTTGPSPGTLALNASTGIPPDYSEVSIAGEYNFVSGTTAALANIQFTASGNALGEWELYVVNEWPGGGSPVTSFFDDGFNDFQFANLNVGQGNPSQALNVGTVIVTPEPSTWILVAIGGVAAAGMRYARRRQVTRA